jgi:hypothetical protein
MSVRVPVMSSSSSMPPMVAKVGPLGILTEIDRRDFGRVNQSLTHVRAKVLVEPAVRRRGYY